MDSDKGLVLGFLRECGALELPQLDHDMFQPVHREATSRKKKMATFYLLKQLRSPLPRYQEIRRNGAWEEHVTKCLYKRGEFVNRYHMLIHASQCASGGIEPIDSNIVMFVGQDEAIFKQFLFHYKMWVGPNRERPLLPKDEGIGTMISAFICREHMASYE